MTLWSGRFRGKLDPQAWAWNASLPFDQRLAQQDVRGSLAWAEALYRAGVLTANEYGQIADGLQTIAAEFAANQFAFAEGDEDIHTAVERRLGELIGPLAGKLHTGRSRNDQVATDFRLWLLDTLPGLNTALVNLQASLLTLAQAHVTTLMPGYTHLQHAQPITLAHWLMAHFWPLQRDRERLADLRKRVATLPLGSGALAGTTFPVDRFALAQALGFDAPAPNSLDAVSDRDFAAEFLFCCALCGVHLSRLAEGVILFGSAEFGFLELSDAYATGSSLMPQKKNPDVFELTRAKAGVLIGLLSGLLTTLKGLPSAYDKDLQEDKPPVFQAADILLSALPVLAGALATLTVHPERMRAALDTTMMATDLADYLVQKGIPFRQAHEIVGRAVRWAEEHHLDLGQLSLDEWRQLGPFEEDVFTVFDPMKAIERRCAFGGTAPIAVQEQMEHAKRALQSAL